ncbi:hypothetical protein ACVWZL_009192 [Bradyrhizobium sp. GM2.4]
MAIEKLEWYALRWKAEVFHKVMKSGCRAEEARLETAERLTKFLARHRDGQLAHLLPHHVRTSEARRCAGDSPHLNRNRDARCHRRGAVQAVHLAQDPRHLLAPDCHAGRLPRAQPRSAARKHGGVAERNTPQRHRPRPLNQNSSTMWVIESFAGCLRCARYSRRNERKWRTRNREDGHRKATDRRWLTSVAQQIVIPVATTLTCGAYNSARRHLGRAAHLLPQAQPDRSIRTTQRFKALKLPKSRRRPSSLSWIEPTPISRAMPA